MDRLEAKEDLDSDDALRAYAQWVTITVIAVNANLTVKDAQTKWGKFHEPGDKGKEINANAINGTVIKDGESYTIASCGRSSASSGTQGSFAVYDGDQKVFKYSWDCPWGSKKNTDELEPDQKANFRISKTGGNFDSGALGNITITAMKNN